MSRVQARGTRDAACEARGTGDTIGRRSSVDGAGQALSEGDRNPYRALGVRRDASDEEISRAYRRAARATHPDGHPDDPSAEGLFKSVTAAYETLRDPRRRADYDRAHPRVGSAPPREASPAPWRDELRTRTAPSWARDPVRIGRDPEPPPAAYGRARPMTENELFELTFALLRRFRRGWFRPY